MALVRIRHTQPNGHVRWLESVVPADGTDIVVWSTDPANPSLYLGEPSETEDWPNLDEGAPGHKGSLPGDEFVDNRPKILFNPRDGRVAYPLLRPNIGQRPPLTPNGHTGTPFLATNATPENTSSAASFVK